MTPHSKSLRDHADYVFRDFSGNQMGDIGARMLAKALQLNTKLHTIHWDNNNTSPQGFHDIAAALET